MTVIKRNGAQGVRWGVKITVQGKQRWVGTYATRAEAKRVEREELLKAETRRGGDETCDEFAARWTTDFPRPRAATDKYNGEAVKKFAEDFKGVRLRALSRAQARDWVLDSNNQWRHSAVRAMFHDALSLELVEFNPFANLRLPRSRGRRDITALTTDEVGRLADCAVAVHGEGFGDELRALILFAAYTGCRWGECCALTHEDIDWDAGVATISKTLSNNATEVMPPKNGKTRRVIIPEIALTALREMPRHLGRDLVFATPGGKTFTKSHWHYYWNPIRARFGRAVAFHEMRHAAASWLVYQVGLPPLQAAQQLGHSDPRLIVGLYAHGDEEQILSEIRAAVRRPPQDITRLSRVRDERAEDTSQP